MKSLTQLLNRKVSNGEKLFIPYIMAGTNGLDRLEDEIRMLSDAGANAIELGVPFSDPVADGPVIQQAGIQSRNNGTTLKKIIQTLQEINSPVPLILMGYTNSFFHYGIEQLFKELASTDVKGLIIPDLPFEHRDLIQEPAIDSDLAFITLVSLTSSNERISELVNEAEGFIYAVTINGTTGMNRQYQEQLYEHLQNITDKSKIPVLAGFGITTSEHIAKFNTYCDGVVIGSLIVDSLNKVGIDRTGERLTALFAG